MRRRVFVSLVALLGSVSLGASLLGAAAPATAVPKPTPVAVGTGGAVVSDTPESTRAGIEVLRNGGNATDAAVAVAAALGVTDPYVAGLGGGGFFVYYDAKKGKVSTLDGRETAPLAADRKLFVDPKTGEVLDFPDAVNSGLSVGVPGMLATWERALKRWGTRSLAAMLAPARKIARDGFVVNEAFRQQTAQNADRFRQFTPTAKLFLPGGKPPKVGSVFRNPDLARTYAEIAREGTSAFYNGRIGRDLVQAVRDLPLAPDAEIVPRPGKMAPTDLAAYRVREQAPTQVNYRGYDVYGMAPSSSGGITVGEALNILGTTDLSEVDTTQKLHRYLEASRLAFADRARWIGDDRYTEVPQRELLSKKYAASRACLIDPKRAAAGPVDAGNPYAPEPCQRRAGPAERNQGAHTNHFVVSDRWGNVVSYTNTIEQLGGSAITVPGRGFLLNNELTDFDFEPAEPGVPSPNLPAPGKRPRSSMSPTIVLDDGRPVFTIGSPGGATIITTVLQILLNRIDRGMSLPDAIAAPRASQRNEETTQAEPAFLELPEARKLRALGHRFEVDTSSSLDPQVRVPPGIGVAAGLEFREDGTVVAAGEPVRRGGTSAAVVRPSR